MNSNQSCVVRLLQPLGHPPASLAVSVGLLSKQQPNASQVECEGWRGPGVLWECRRIYKDSGNQKRIQEEPPELCLFFWVEGNVMKAYRICFLVGSEGGITDSLIHLRWFAPEDGIEAIVLCKCVLARLRHFARPLDLLVFFENPQHSH